MNKSNQERMPIYEALREYKSNRIVSFDVPGHKQGRATTQLTAFLGKECMSVDVNSMKPLDNLCHPTSVIKESMDLAAAAFGAAHAFFMVNGTSSAVQTMVMSVCKHGDKIIMPRNVHRSAINALILSGAQPIYVDPKMNSDLGISLGMTVQGVKRAIQEHPDAKAVLVNNPPYYGICSNLPEIVRIAHLAGMKVLVDEAHGTHFYFGENMPVNAMAAGADMAAVSMHKTGGSLTQSSLLLLGEGVNHDYVRQIINHTQTTSASYLLMSSLDIARSNLAINGKTIFKKVVDIVTYAREEINRLGGYYAFGNEIVDGDAVYAFDTTKLSIHTRNIGLAGIEVYDLLRDDFGIQIEFGDIGNILAIISVGDRHQDIERLIAALAEIKRIYQKNPTGLYDHEYIEPKVELTPQAAFYAPKVSLPLDRTEGCVCGEFVMCYPPGIPILAPGEKITKDILDYIRFAKDKGCLITGPLDVDIEYLSVVEV
ncbi:MAG: aminotransferase class I/II-fold pyridoxal phosphate-dependent enzyme [Paludibacteraceae bacterium]|nr:aminotransferase class I/II-fold pyridoxal phosphate-dependent enzyme [Paludibacteraceae bacterium]